MALQFPASPTNGQVYEDWQYNATTGAWESLPLESATVVTSDTAPPNPEDGDMWYNSTDGTTYVYYVDPNGGQWVEMVAPVTASGYLSPNYVINGAFDINQRNFTSITNTGAYGFDRWTFYQQGGGTTVVSAQTFAPGEAPGSLYGARNFFRAVTSGYSAANSATNFTQPIENVRTLAGQTITVSFWAKAGSGTPKVSIEMQQIFGTGGSAVSLINAGFVTLSTSWTRYSLTVNIPSISGKTIGTNDSLNVVFWFNAGTDFASRTNSIGVQSNTFDIWGVQVEEGSVATPFRRSGNTIQEELANCQRYYVQFDVDPSTGYGGIASGMFTAAGNSGVFYIPLPVPMRINPASITFAATSGVYIADTNSSPITNATVLLEPNYKSNKIAAVYTSGGGTGTGYRPGFLNVVGAGKYLGISAEL